jgi:hypothetical protein
MGIELETLMYERGKQIGERRIQVRESIIKRNHTRGN